MSSTFTFKPVDLEGADTLQILAKADLFNNWMYETIKPFVRGRVLEIGSGIGNISKFFVEAGFEIMLTDLREVYCQHLEEEFSSKPNVLGVATIDLTDPDFDTNYADYLGSFDTVFAMNVVEHIYDDALATANCHKLLRKDGHIIILVPAFQWLYNAFDNALEHYRRYNKARLNTLLTSNKFEIIHSQYFNAAGILGWFVSGKLMKNDTIPEGQMQLYNKLVPIFKLIDRIIFRSFGLSVVSVGVKK